MDAINGMLATAGFAALPRAGVSVGLGGYYAYGRALLGADVARTVFSVQGPSTGRTDELGAAQGMLTASYAIYTAPRINMFPTLGVGVGRIAVTLHDQSGSTANNANQPTFAEVAQNPGSATTISGNHLLFALGGGGDYLFARQRADHVGVLVGLRAGMLFAPNRTTWTTGSRMVITGPDGGAEGPFVRVVFGIGTH